MSFHRCPLLHLPLHFLHCRLQWHNPFTLYKPLLSSVCRVLIQIYSRSLGMFMSICTLILLNSIKFNKLPPCSPLSRELSILQAPQKKKTSQQNYKKEKMKEECARQSRGSWYFIKREKSIRAYFISLCNHQLIPTQPLSMCYPYQRTTTCKYHSFLVGLFPLLPMNGTARFHLTSSGYLFNFAITEFQIYLQHLPCQTTHKPPHMLF